MYSSLAAAFRQVAFFIFYLQGSVLRSVLNSIINFNTRLTKIYSYALRKSKLFRKDMYHFNNFITFIRC